MVSCGEIGYCKHVEQGYALLCFVRDAFVQVHNTLMKLGVVYVLGSLALLCIPTRSSTGPLSTSCFFFQAEDGIRDYKVTGVQTCALPISDCIWNCASLFRKQNGTARFVKTGC